MLGMTQEASIIWNGVLLASAVVPVLVVLAICVFFFRAARRNDEREARARRNQGVSQGVAQSPPTT